MCNAVLEEYEVTFFENLWFCSSYDAHTSKQNEILSCKESRRKKILSFITFYKRTVEEHASKENRK